MTNTETKQDMIQALFNRGGYIKQVNAEILQEERGYWGGWGRQPRLFGPLFSPFKCFHLKDKILKITDNFKIQDI